MFRGPGLLMMLATVSWLVLMVRQVPCRQTLADQPVNTFYRLCYSDIGVLYQVRGLAQGQILYRDTDWEYPVLSGGFVEVARFFTGLFGFPARPDVVDQDALNAANVFFAVCAVMLFVCYLVLVELQRRMAPDHGWQQGLMIAVAPVVMAEALINWDMFAVMLTAAAMYVWARGRPGWSGVLYGLAIAAKLYPLFILGPLLLLCIRAAKWDALSKLLIGAVGGWVVVNAPVYAMSPSGWTYFWTFNADRGADLGSVWYVFSLGGLDMSNAGLWSLAMMVAGCLGITYLVFAAPRRPRVGQVAFLVIALFLVVNKVYSPQYALWLLPLLVLARPVWRDWAVWNLAELAYFAAIWGHLAGTLHPGNGGPDRVYWLAVFLRVGVTVWLMVVVALDILNPDEDPVRANGIDDPIGGVLAGARDLIYADDRPKPSRTPHPGDTTKPTGTTPAPAS